VARRIRDEDSFDLGTLLAAIKVEIADVTGRV
jgi:hypothetical protein